MGGFSSVTGDETIMFADNVSFNGTQRGGKITTDGELLIGSTALPHIQKGRIVSAGGTVQVTYSTPNINLEAGTTITTIYTTDSTWNINSRTLWVQILAWGAGAGGGGGGVDAVGNWPWGGQSGAPGAFVNITLPASVFAASTAITIGTGGAGGAGATIAGGVGTAGAQGGDTIIPLISGSVTALGAPYAAGGASNVLLQADSLEVGASAVEFLGSGFSTLFSLGTGAISQHGDQALATPGDPVYGYGIGTAGGAGNLISAGVLTDGSDGGSIYIGYFDITPTARTRNSLILAGGAGGIGDAANGSPGLNASTQSLIIGGTGGGGGGGSLLTNAGNGGNGGIPGGGGGGGGAALTGTGAGGTGGDGGRGEVWIIEYIG